MCRPTPLACFCQNDKQESHTNTQPATAVIQSANGSLENHNNTVTSTNITTSTSFQREKSMILPTNLRIAFMGDSTSRYMYLSLVYYLRRRGTWLQNDDVPNPLWEKQFFSWFQFYWFTNQGLYLRTLRLLSIVATVSRMARSTRSGKIGIITIPIFKIPVP
ncbi:hypothetical protein ACA910_003272 [Epithemia clementina (nom. ined.)]